MSSRKVFMEVGEDGIAVVIIDNPPVNSLATAVFNDLYRRFQEVQRRDDIKAVVITGANGKFSGGADIRGFQKRQNSGEDGEKVILPGITVINNVIEGCQKPVVAAIEGFALGGGLELAMACHERVAAFGALLGLPELKLGIIPGLGGTQRLPRLVGMLKALHMLLTSTNIDADEAKETGLVDEVVEPSTLLLVARGRALKLSRPPKSWQTSLDRMDKLGSRDEALKVLNIARSSARRKIRNVDYPFLCFDVIEEGLCKGGEAGIMMENKISKALVTTAEAKALMHVFFAQRSAVKVPGITNLGLEPRPIRKVAVVGLGLMGSGIATALIVSNIPVLLKDVDIFHLQKGVSRIRGNIDGLIRKGKMTSLQALNQLALMKVTEDYTDFKDVDLVIESVLEDASLKQKVFQELASFCAPQCILASNTSCIDIHILGASIDHPERVIGMHFFSPAHVMQLLEIMTTEWTSPQVIVDLLGFAKILKKIPLVVKSSFGFAANRIFVPYLLSAFLLVDLGLDPYQIDTVLKGFGMPMGPFRVTDFTGIETFHLVSQVFHEKFPGQFHQSALPELLLKDNRLGDSTRSGFYEYNESGEGLKTVELNKYIEKSRRLAKLKGVKKATMTVSDKEIVEMVLFPVINEAFRVLEENGVLQSAALDIASVLGMGFPAYRGGIIFWADNLGLSYVSTQLKEWSMLYGNVYKPCPFLEKVAASKAPLGQFSMDSSKL